MSIQDAKEPGGFWLSNDLIDVHAPVLGPRAVYLYCILVRTCTPKNYPTVYHLSMISGLTATFIKKCLWTLYECRLLNTFDMEKILGPDFTAVASASKGRIQN